MRQAGADEGEARFDGGPDEDGPEGPSDVGAFSELIDGVDADDTGDAGTTSQYKSWCN